MLGLYAPDFFTAFDVCIEMIDSDGA